MLGTDTMPRNPLAFYPVADTKMEHGTLGQVDNVKAGRLLGIFLEDHHSSVIAV
jgi:hypothetical protein